jgi:hypothetical protein
MTYDFRYTDYGVESARGDLNLCDALEGLPVQIAEAVMLDRLDDFRTIELRAEDIVAAFDGWETEDQEDIPVGDIISDLLFEARRGAEEIVDRYDHALQRQHEAYERVY